MLVPEITVPVPGHILRSDINFFGETICEECAVRRSKWSSIHGMRTV